MRSRVFWMGFGAVSVVFAAACAASGDVAPRTEPSLEPSMDGGGMPPSDAGADAEESESDGAPPCSVDGWCPTTLPALQSTVLNVFPFENRAFGLMSGTHIGHKIAEWTPSNGWQFITKKLQFPTSSAPASLWAPSEDEVYFTVDYASILDTGVTFGVTVARGRRPVPPETDWSWATSNIECDHLSLGNPSPIWASAGALYTATCGKIYRSEASGQGADASAPSWLEEGYVDDVATNPVKFRAIGGTGPDDLWFGGGRLSADETKVCATLVHKTPAGYQAVIDSVPTTEGCTPIGAAVALEGMFMANLHAISKNRVVGAATPTGSSTNSSLVSVSTQGGQVDVVTSKPTDDDAVGSPVLGAVWGLSSDDLLVVGTRGSVGTILRAQSVWGDSASYSYSRLAINGVPNSGPINMIRGTSNKNIWAVGGNRAYHKVTP